MKTHKLFLFSLFFSYIVSGQGLEENYIARWKSFHPSKALASGMHPYIFQYENRSTTTVNAWLEYNQAILRQVEAELDSDGATNRINLRLLRVQTQSEIDEWEKQAPQTNSVLLYSSLISRSLKPVIDADFLTKQEKVQLLIGRMGAIQQLCSDGESQLTNTARTEAERGIDQLNAMIDFISKDLVEVTKKLESSEDWQALRNTTSKSIQRLVEHIETKLLPSAEDKNGLLGRDEYARRLALYTDSELTPEKLTEIALKEIEKVKKLMIAVSKEYLTTTYPNKPLPKATDKILKAALNDMQKDVPANGTDYLEFWQELSAAATDFLEKEQIATLPKNQTLRIIPAPESAGPAARIGWVDSAPPFAPNPLTTLYLPSIPETLPEQEQKDFWASFNKPFNRIIVIHELFPGHYMQLKVSRETPHSVRLLFPYGVYIEGWATFCERVALDNGWEKDNHLSMLAHLRKRLENANRAYTSVQVHCNNWSKEQVMEFSTNTSLVAPQFAKSLWGRIMRSPLQLTSYFLGGAQFTELLASEKERLGTQFDLKYFMDTIMKAGPIPIDEFEKIFNPINDR